jgi:hypothetical protein
MGYTHYWYREKEISRDTYRKILADFSQVKPAMLIDEPEFRNEEEDLCFRCYEPMIFNRITNATRPVIDYTNDGTTGKFFECCKTNHQPADLAVTALLIIVKKILGDKSTGNPL